MLKVWIIKLAMKWLKELDEPELKRVILTEAVKKFYNSIDSEDILRQNTDGTWIFEGRQLSQSEVANLQQEAQLIKSSKLWRVIKLDIKYQLGKKMFEEAKCLDDILWGQLLTYLNDIIQTRLRKM